MEFQIGNVITIAFAVLGYAVGYGILNQKVNDLRDQRKTCDKRFEHIESEHDSAVKSLNDTMRHMDGTLNQLVGKIDVLFNHYMKKGE